jgi:hypothetical protein
MSPRQHGIVLTYVDNLDQLDDCMRQGGYDTVKVVTNWGLPTGWSRADKERVLRYPHVIVRTTAGDPSYGQQGGSTPGTLAMPFANQIHDEIAEWYSIRDSIYIEIGNEPNVYNPDDDFIWQYRAHLDAAIHLCRQDFPKAQLIAPGLILARKILDRDHDPGHFLDIASDVMSQCDLIGVHIYEHFGFRAEQQQQPPFTTGHLREALRIYPPHFGNKPWYITEYGINDTNKVPMHEKGRRYAGLVHLNESTPSLPGNVVGAVYYHLDTKGDNQPQYHIYPHGDAAYQQRIVAAPAGGVLGESETTPPFPTFPTTQPPPAVLGEPESAPADPFSTSLAGMIAALAEQERAATARRAQATTGIGEPFTSAEETELRRIQAFQASLEAALSCAGDNSSAARQLIKAASRQVALWSDQRNDG